MKTIEAIFGVVLDASWRMTCLIFVILAVRMFLRGHVSARIFFWVWIAVAIRLLIPFSVPVRWSPFVFAEFAHRAPPVAADKGAAAPYLPSTMDSSRLVPPAPVLLPESQASGVPELSPIQWATCVWGVGVCVLLIAYVGAYRRFALRLRRRSIATDPALTLLAARAAAKLGAHDVQIKVTDLVGAPALHGIFRPELLFPPGLLEKLTPRELQLIVAHELGHFHRHDLWAQALIHFARTLHWFNPVVWIATRAARHDCELACDEYVVRRLGSLEPEVYGATLLKVLGLASPSSRAPLGLGVLESKQQIKRRIQMIIANKQSSLARTILGFILLAIVAVFGLTREARALEPATSSSQTVTSTPPQGWWKNGTDNAAAYVAGIDGSQTHEGLPSAYVKSIQPAVEGFGGMMQMCSAENYLGKRLRFSAWMKTANANGGGAHLWFRVDGKERGEILQFDNMGKRPIQGTTEWQQYSIVLDVPANAAALAYGFFVNGTGQAWVSGVKIEEVSADVPSTNMTEKNDLPKAPVNLKFD